eukprot:813594-Pyramimonas_sp.AAC.1
MHNNSPHARRTQGHPRRTDLDLTPLFDCTPRGGAGAGLTSTGPAASSAEAAVHRPRRGSHVLPPPPRSSSSRPCRLGRVAPQEASLRELKA